MVSSVTFILSIIGVDTYWEYNYFHIHIDDHTAFLILDKIVKHLQRKKSPRGNFVHH